MKHSFYLSLLAAAGLLLASCGDNNNGMNPGEVDPGTMSLQFNGGSWSGNGSFSEIDVSGSGYRAVVLVAVNSTTLDGFVLTLYNSNGQVEGNYSFLDDGNSQLNHLATGAYFHPDTSLNAFYNPANPVGEVVISTYDSTAGLISGTVSGDFFRSNGALLSLRDGAFTELPKVSLP